MASATNAATEPAAARDRLAWGLRGHLNRFAHVVINVSDLDRAVAFYEATLPVQRRARIDGPAQAYIGLGIERGRCRGWVLENISDAPPPGDLVAEFPARFIHLIEWLDPAPTGRPYREANHVGIYRQNVLVGDLDAAYANVLAHGGRPYAEPSWIVLTPDGYKVRVFGFRDPDGATLEMIGCDDADTPAAFQGMLHHCNLNVRDLATSYRFYRDVIGLDLAIYLAPTALQPATNGSLGDALANPDGSPYTGGQMRFAATLLGLRSDTRNPLDVLEWDVPKPYGSAYTEATNLGIIRVAFEVDDIDAAHRRLTLTGQPGIGPVETWDMGEFGARRVVIFRDPDGIMLELIEHIPIETARPPFDA